jgi:hypothetical protein
MEEENSLSPQSYIQYPQDLMRQNSRYKSLTLVLPCTQQCIICVQPIYIQAETRWCRIGPPSCLMGKRDRQHDGRFPGEKISYTCRKIWVFCDWKNNIRYFTDLVPCSAQLCQDSRSLETARFNSVKLWRCMESLCPLGRMWMSVVVHPEREECVPSGLFSNLAVNLRE